MYKPVPYEIFHVHTRRCKHAGNHNDEEYIEKAIELGALRIVFTDHAPFPGNPFGNRMDYEELSEYIETIKALKEKYKNRIEILCGLEAEYLPSYADHISSLRNMNGIDVMVLGQHFYEHEQGRYSFSDDDKSKEYLGLLKAMTQGIKSYCFDVVAHPDRVFRRIEKFGEEEKQATEDFLAEVKEHYYLKLELNYSSMHSNNQYRKEFWELWQKKTSAEVIFGFDAHSPDEIAKAWDSRIHFTGKPFTRLDGVEKSLTCALIKSKDCSQKPIPPLTNAELKEFVRAQKQFPGQFEHMNAAKFFSICRCLYNELVKYHICYDECLYDDELYCLFRMFTEETTGLTKITSYESEEEFWQTYDNRCGYHLEEIVFGRANIILDEFENPSRIKAIAPVSPKGAKDIIKKSKEVIVYFTDRGFLMAKERWMPILVRAIINCHRKGFPVYLRTSESEYDNI